MDLTDIEKRYEGAGHPAYHPKIILKLLILGQIDGIRSSRNIAKNARENVVYMYLAGLLQPDFRTITDFLLRGIKGAKIEFNLACIASNLRKIWNYLGGSEGKTGAVTC